MGVTATMDTTAATATMGATVTMAGGDAVAMDMAAIDTTAANQQQQRQWKNNNIINISDLFCRGYPNQKLGS